MVDIIRMSELELQVARCENYKKEKVLPIAGLEHLTLVSQYQYRNRLAIGSDILSTR